MNLPDERCYQVYKAIIEPNIKAMIESYFKDWQTIEMQVTGIMMKHKGVFTTRQIVISIDEKDQDFSLIRDADEFRKLKRMFFSKKIGYLLDNGLISQPIFDLLSHLSKRRNKVHDYDGILTEDDRILFAAGAGLLQPTWIAGTIEEEKESMKYSIEHSNEAAKQLLKAIKDWEASGSTGSMLRDYPPIEKVKGGWESHR